MVRAYGRALLRHVVGVGGTSADGAGGDRAHAPPPAAWPERPCVRLGERSLRKAMASGALRMSEGLMTMIPSNRFWRSVTWLVRLDMAICIAIAVGLPLWLMWH